MAYIYDSHYRARLDADLVRNEQDDPLLCSITLDGGEGEPAVTIELGPDGVRELRLMLTRIERQFKTGA